MSGTLDPVTPIDPTPTNRQTIPYADRRVVDASGNPTTAFYQWMQRINQATGATVVNMGTVITNTNVLAQNETVISNNFTEIEQQITEITNTITNIVVDNVPWPPSMPPLLQIEVAPLAIPPPLRLEVTPPAMPAAPPGVSAGFSLGLAFFFG